MDIAEIGNMAVIAEDKVFATYKGGYTTWKALVEDSNFLVERLYNKDENCFSRSFIFFFDDEVETFIDFEFFDICGPDESDTEAIKFTESIRAKAKEWNEKVLRDSTKAWERVQKEWEAEKNGKDYRL